MTAKMRRPSPTMAMRRRGRPSSTMAMRRKMKRMEMPGGND
jgi:hypothetical protein